MRRIGMVGAAVAAVMAAGTARPAAAQTAWAGTLSGAQQVPPNASTGSGFTTITLDGNLLTANVSWTGITGGPLTGGHIHCCAAPGSNAAIAVEFVGLPSTTVGSYNNTFDLMSAATYTTAFLSANGGTAAGARTALLTGLNTNLAYVNLHDATYPGGEIRANVAAVPEPTTFALAALGVGGAGLLARRRRSV